jgi:cell division protein FtsI (penicillin-binding protein 3)
MWLLFAAAICVRAAQIQVLQAPRWRSLAEDQHRKDLVVAAARGSILDRDETPLSVSRERARVNVAPHEIQQVDSTRALLGETLGLSTARVASLTSTQARWRVVPDLYPVSVRERLGGRRGVHVERVLQRFHPHGDLARGLLGAVIDGEGRGGIEEAFDTVLRGTPGREVVARAASGAELPGERMVVAPPRSGGAVVLTLNMDLQEIAQQALERAIEQTEAHGGDILITDPRTGEVLALFSSREGRRDALSAVNTPFEPGSTLKPFTIAGLLEHRLASMGDTVDVGDGSWEVEGRTLTDTHTSGLLTVREALRESSNVGVAKAAQRMTPGIQFENLRDFGFGALTGIELPGEIAGTLRRPERWTAQSSASLAIGYEVSVTPLQMAMAYGALANGGVLMQPQLVREVRDPDGRVIRSFEPRPIRRVVSTDVARAVGRALVDVVEDGTGTSARMGSFLVAGKSGTARWNAGRGYEAGAYSSSFVGYFPADKPQLVVFVKLDRPQVGYYGGAVAAPVTRATMEAALAASAAHLDRGALLESLRDEPVRIAPTLSATLAARPLDPPIPPLTVVGLERGSGAGAGAVNGRISLPDVGGLPARVAVRRLHALGLRVARIGVGDIRATQPPPGTLVSPGDTIRLTYRGASHE